MKTDTWTGLHLGMEFNDEPEANAPCMDKQMERLIKSNYKYDNKAVCNNSKYFTILTAQVKCFGGENAPAMFRYDDVSQVKASGKQTPPKEYRENVKKAVNKLLVRITEVKPNLILIAGRMAFDEFTKQVLPKLETQKGLPRTIHVIRVRNPSPQGHFGISKDVYMKQYAAFNGLAELEKQVQNLANGAEPMPPVMLWEMTASKKGNYKFSLTSLPPPSGKAGKP